MEIRKPVRVSHSHVQTIDADPDTIFPLYCPVREVEWAKGWEPRFVVSESGLVEKDCLFVTPSPHSDAIWVVTRHEPETHRVEMIKCIPGVVVTKLEIGLEPIEDHRTAARITYTHTSLSAEGDRFVREQTEDRYRELMRDWEREMSEYLASAETSA